MSGPPPGEPAGDAARDLEADVYRYIIERARYESIRATDAGMIAKAVGDRFRAAQRPRAGAPGGEALRRAIQAVCAYRSRVYAYCPDTEYPTDLDREYEDVLDAVDAPFAAAPAPVAPPPAVDARIDHALEILEVADRYEHDELVSALVDVLAVAPPPVAPLERMICAQGHPSYCAVFGPQCATGDACSANESPSGPPARGGAGPTDEELKIALTEMGKRVMCLHLELEPSIANDVHQCFEALRRLVAARLAPGATGATGGGA